MRYGLCCVLPHNLSIIYPDSILTLTVRYDVDKCHVNGKDLNGCSRSGSADCLQSIHWSTATCIFTNNSLNPYIFNYHIPVSLNINYAERNCYLVHTRLTPSIPVFHQSLVWDKARLVMNCNESDTSELFHPLYAVELTSTFVIHNMAALPYCITNRLLRRGNVVKIDKIIKIRDENAMKWQSEASLITPSKMPKNNRHTTLDNLLCEEKKD